MEVWSIAIVVLLAVLVGALLPVLVQLYLTLRTTRSTMDRIGPRVEATLDEVQKATEHLNHTLAGVDQGAQRLIGTMAAVGDVGRSLRKVSSSMRGAGTVGAAIGPAIVAALRALFEARSRKPGRRRRRAKQADPGNEESKNTAESTDGGKTDE